MMRQTLSPRLAGVEWRGAATFSRDLVLRIQLQPGCFVSLRGDPHASVFRLGTSHHAYR